MVFSNGYPLSSAPNPLAKCTTSPLLPLPYRQTVMARVPSNRRWLLSKAPGSVVTWSKVIAHHVHCFRHDTCPGCLSRSAAPLQAVLDQDFPQVTIFRPGALNRLSTDRVIEKVWTAFNIGLRVDTLAKAMVREAEVGPTEGRKAPQYIVGNSAISKVAESDSHRMC